MDVHEGVSWEKPPDVTNTFKNEHWRKFLEKIRLPNNQHQLLYLGRYICREWNARHTGAERLEDFRIAYVLEQTLPDYRSSAPQRKVLWEHRC